jgi:UDP-N-acetylglucosamine 2-epimerase (non-hydrolysing)
MRITAIVGARPNFMKIAPIMWEIQRRSGISAALVHTGQHYDQRMSQLFFDQLHIPRPDIDLEVGSGSHAVQTAEVMKRVEPVLIEQKPDLLLVVGDINSTLACALVAAKLDIPVAHVEAGLRSFDRGMPEEINRVLTDAISRWLFVSEPSGVTNLKHEGVPDEYVFFVGNVMIDTLLASRARIEESRILSELGVAPKKYAVLTLHRPSNVDDSRVLHELLQAIGKLQREMPIIFPVHPRTRKRMESMQLDQMPNLKLTEPLGYLDFMKLVTHARLVLTDSGGIQEETTVLGVPCVTLRSNTERPATVEEGGNILVGPDPQKMVAAWRQIVDGNRQPGSIPRLWDGKAAGRIIDVLLSHPPAGCSANATALPAVIAGR